MSNKIFALLLPILVLALYGLFLAHEVNLITADLGRHIRNGEFLFSQPEILKTNFYSYTQPAYPVINHHWGTGLIFFWIWKISGLAGVHFFFIVLSILTLFIFFRIAQKRGGLALASLCALLLIPLLNERTEIRPEVMSYFFAAIFFWILINKRWLWFLPILQVIWVNTHIYFFLGPVIVGVFLIQEVLTHNPLSLPLTLRGRMQEESPPLKVRGGRGALLIILALTILATLINPFGLKGALLPLTIFQDYGYRLVENQPVWFIEKLIANPNFFIFKIIFAVLVLSFILALIRNRRAIKISNLILAAGFSLAGWLAIRNFTIFGFFAIPILAENFRVALTPSSSPPIPSPFQGEGQGENPSPTFSPFRRGGEGEVRRGWAILGLVIFVFLLTLSGELQAVYPYNQNFGLGVAKDNSAAADFFKQEKIKGPIFNNYDIGGYLIYHLYPGEKVFVDNRPEAYPSNFFQETYIAMQENEEKWQEQDGKFDFNTIFFSHRDATPWGQKFLIKRVEDQEWAPVFADQYAIIFLKRDQQNQDLIAKYEIPKENFRIIQTQ